jgi:hypothetical protein
MDEKEVKDALKEYMEYTEETKTCDRCVSVTKVDLGVCMCELNPACHLRIAPYAHCRFWEELSE